MEGPDKLSPMALVYNRLAGQSIERIAALSDGIFAVAMTLLVLEIHVPAADGVHSEHDLVRILEALSPPFLVYLMSFLTLGTSGTVSRSSSITWPAEIGTSLGSTSPS